MSNIEIINGPERRVGDYIRKALKEAVDCRIATAYVTKGGLAVIGEHIGPILERNGSVSFIHGADGRVTSPDALKQLANLNMCYPGMTYRVHPNVQAHERLFHPKMYFAADNHGKFVSILGSSNTTSKGLTENVEVNIVIRGSHHDPEFQQCSSSFDTLMGNYGSVEPTAEWICKYEHIYNLHRQVEQKHITQQLADLYDSLCEPISQQESWVPKTQDECILKAVQELVRDGGLGKYASLKQIYKRARVIAVANNLKYKETNWKASVRSSLNINTVGGYTSGKDWYERVGGVGARTGKYRLSEGGRLYAPQR